MGNRPGGFRLLGNGHCSYRIEVGEAATISMKKRGIKLDEMTDKMTQTWEVLYNVQGVISTFSITKTTETNSDEELNIKIEDYTHGIETDLAMNGEANYVTVRKAEAEAEAGLLDVYRWGQSYRFFVNHRVPYTAKFGNSSRGETKTSFNAYGYGTRMSLFVMESKSRRSNEKPYMVTVAHYYVKSSSGGIFNFNASGVDIGLSMVVTIRVSRTGRLDFNVDGPVEHPSSALFYMIEEATGTGTWKPTACPHCVNVQRQSDESEDSDSSLRAPRQSHGSLQSIGNRGRVNGNANGSFFQGNKIKFVKRWI